MYSYKTLDTFGVDGSLDARFDALDESAYSKHIV